MLHPAAAREDIRHLFEPSPSGTVTSVPKGGAGSEQLQNFGG